MSESDRLNEALEALLADRSPAGMASDLDADEQQMLQMAQMLHGGRHAAPDEQFVDDLRYRLHEKPGLMSRRAAFLSGIGGLAAGLAAGFGLNRSTQPSQFSGLGAGAIWPSKGKWIRVATVADLPEGSVRPFQAGALQGFLVHRQGTIHAVSRVCTHMGCSLDFSKEEQRFVCPCHGAEFDMQGGFGYYPGHKSSERLTPLNRIVVRVKDAHVEVLGA